MQRLLRGRAIQSSMFVGKEKRLELIKELRMVETVADLDSDVNDVEKRNLEQHKVRCLARAWQPPGVVLHAPAPPLLTCPGNPLPLANVRLPLSPLRAFVLSHSRVGCNARLPRSAISSTAPLNPWRAG